MSELHDETHRTNLRENERPERKPTEHYWDFRGSEVHIYITSPDRLAEVLGRKACSNSDYNA